MNCKRTRKTLCFDSDEYSKEKGVRKAIQDDDALPNSENERFKVGAEYGALLEVYMCEHLPTLRNSAQQKNAYLLKDFIEPRFGQMNRSRR